MNKPLSTGILSIDATIPLGRGQRELIIGDRKIGKTTIALEAIINQRQTWWNRGGQSALAKATADKPVICVYVSIGQKKGDLARVVKTLEKHHALEYTIVVAATASDSATENYLAPYVGCTLAEYFRDKGEDVLVVYDDLTKHSWAYRNISLLLGRPPGREAYPGDIFTRTRGFWRGRLSLIRITAEDRSPLCPLLKQWKAILPDIFPPT